MAAALDVDEDLVVGGERLQDPAGEAAARPGVALHAEGGEDLLQPGPAGVGAGEDGDAGAAGTVVCCTGSFPGCGAARTTAWLLPADARKTNWPFALPGS